MDKPKRRKPMPLCILSAPKVSPLIRDTLPTSPTDANESNNHNGHPEQEWHCGAFWFRGCSFIAGSQDRKYRQRKVYTKLIPPTGYLQQSHIYRTYKSFRTTLTFAWFFLPTSMIIRIFATSVLAKPLNNAQIVRGVFCLYTFEQDESKSLYKAIWIFRKSR